MNLNTEAQCLIPILLIIFNRPDTTQLVFDRIKLIKPKCLLVSADGPSEKNNKDNENCAVARKIIDQVNWDCEVKKLFHSQNYGCKNAVSKGISWFFENVEEGIILEDDVVPDITFFNFCSEMLQHYRNNPQIMHIGGNNFLRDKIQRDASYYFSIYPHIWGWATWKRAWDHYDVKIKSFEKVKEQRRIKTLLKNNRAQNYWLKKFEMVYNSQIDTWDYQWVYSIWNNSGICITPSTNLSKNIGFGNEATHTSVVNPFIENQITYRIDKIIHPKEIVVDTFADDYTFKKIFYPNYLIKLKIKIRELLFLIRKKYRLKF